MFQKPPWTSSLLFSSEDLISFPLLSNIEIKISSNKTTPETISNIGPNPTVKATIKNPIKYRIIVSIFGTEKLLTLSQSKPIIAGSNVIPAITATNTTRIVPTPNA